MNEDIEVYLDSSNAGSSYIESLIKSMAILEKLSNGQGAIKKLETVISLELDLAILGAEKAKSEILKQTKDNIVRPIK